MQNFGIIGRLIKIPAKSVIVRGVGGVPGFFPRLISWPSLDHVMAKSQMVKSWIIFSLINYHGQVRTKLLQSYGQTFDVAQSQPTK